MGYRRSAHHLRRGAKKICRCLHGVHTRRPGCVAGADGEFCRLRALRCDHAAGRQRRGAPDGCECGQDARAHLRTRVVPGGLGHGPKAYYLQRRRARRSACCCAFCLRTKAARRRAFPEGSPPPILAAVINSRVILVNALPRWASALESELALESALGHRSISAGSSYRSSTALAPMSGTLPATRRFDRCRCRLHASARAAF